MSCTYSVSAFKGLQWYRQDAGTGLRHLFSVYAAGDVQQKGRLRATLLKDGSSLNITAVQHGDSATYLCAVVTQCDPGTRDLHPNLQLSRSIRAPGQSLDMESMSSFGSGGNRKTLDCTSTSRNLTKEL
ncbi:Hypothetical predicted protein [Marmota monax]|uniref:Ig-like domain-containing protein n=1 Tax=Marmota monax TaxID=9995 RepID=A0A5E4CUI7_MARMO|nr:Hypothetical predicted protein [Marmota monax]